MWHHECDVHFQSSVHAGVAVVGTGACLALVSAADKVVVSRLSAGPALLELSTLSPELSAVNKANRLVAMHACLLPDSARSAL